MESGRKGGEGGEMEMAKRARRWGVTRSVCRVFPCPSLRRTAAGNGGPAQRTESRKIRSACGLRDQTSKIPFGVQIQPLPLSLSPRAPCRGQAAAWAMGVAAAVPEPVLSPAVVAKQPTLTLEVSARD